jgi:hypothetical protein
MKLLKFFQDFPTEDACKAHFKLVRESEGVVCKGCCKTEHWWMRTKSMYKCKNCGRLMSLRSGTVMENSKLPFQYWYIAMHLMTATKKSFSALEMQRQIGHAYYEPIWTMVHKIRRAMANRDEKHMLTGQIELDEAFFVVGRHKDEEDPLKRGAGSQRQGKVLVMAESELVDNPKNPKKKYRCGHVKMLIIEDLKAETINQETENSILPTAELRTDNSKSHRLLHKLVKKHQATTLPGKEGCKLLPWVHTTISNAKRHLLATHHCISAGYLQNYLSEVCYRLNRRYQGVRLFDRLIIAATYHWNQ